MIINSIVMIIILIKFIDRPPLFYILVSEQKFVASVCLSGNRLILDIHSQTVGILSSINLVFHISAHSWAPRAPVGVSGTHCGANTFIRARSNKLYDEYMKVTCLTTCSLLQGLSRKAGYQKHSAHYPASTQRSAVDKSSRTTRHQTDITPKLADLWGSFLVDGLHVPKVSISIETKV